MLDPRLLKALSLALMLLFLLSLIGPSFVPDVGWAPGADCTDAGEAAAGGGDTRVKLEGGSPPDSCRCGEARRDRDGRDESLVDDAGDPSEAREKARACGLVAPLASGGDEVGVTSCGELLSPLFGEYRVSSSSCADS